jgi:hypothetical protein
VVESKVTTLNISKADNGFVVHGSAPGRREGKYVQDTKFRKVATKLEEVHAIVDEVFAGNSGHKLR